MAVFLRGGVLAVCALQWGWPAGVAILPALATSALISYAGNIFFISPATRRYGRGIAWRLAAVGIVSYAVVLRLVYLTLPNLMPEEAYYWNYGQHLAAGYLDHPPLVAWLTSLGTTLFGHDEFGVRIGAVACWAIAALFVFKLARDLHGKTTAFVAVLLFQTLPFFFSTGLLLTPDAPLVACWAGLLFYLHRALIAEQDSAWWAVGACLGLGMLSKYSIATLGLAGLIFAVLDRPTRAVFRTRTPYLAMLLAAALFSPVIFWNATHDWASFGFQSSRRLELAPKFSLHLLAGSVLLLLTPVAAFAIPRALRGSDRTMRFVRVFTLVPLAVFVVFSLRSRVQLNWTGPLWLALLPALAHEIVALGREFQRRTERALTTSWKIVFCAVPIGAGALLHYLALGLPGVGYTSRMELLPIGWDDLGRQVSAISKQFADTTGKEPLLLGMDRYFTSSELAFYGGDGASVAHRVAGRHLFAGISLMYGFWFPAKHQLGQSLVLVAFEKADLERESVARRTVGESPIQRGEITRDGKVIREFFWRTAAEYQRPLKSSMVTPLSAE